MLEDALVKEPATIFNKTWYTVVTSQEDDKNVMYYNNLAQLETRKNQIRTIFFHDANIINRI